MVRSTKSFLRSACVVVLLTTACRTPFDIEQPDSATADEPPDADGGRPDAGPLEVGVYTEPLSAGEWDSMDFEARRKFMGEMVMPAMRRAFQDFDPERFANVNCRTCHGSGAADGSFAMPADLPVLDNAALMNPDESQQAILEFMRTVVRPEFAALLGADSTGPAAVRCTTCHTIAR